MGYTDLVSLHIHGEVRAVAVSGQHGVFQRVLTEPFIHVLGAASLGDPCQRKSWILQYPGPAKLAVDVES